MPSHLPSSFASAAAGQNSNKDVWGKPENRGPGNGWPRREGRPANGTVTFRRPSSTSLGQQSQTPGVSASAAVDTPSMVSSADSRSQDSQYLDSMISIPTTISTASGVQESEPSRYTKDDLLEIFHAQMNLVQGSDVSRLFMAGWNPVSTNGAHTGGVARSGDGRGTQDPSVCWDAGGETFPMGLQEPSLEETESFASDLNSTLKSHANNSNGSTVGVNGRKMSHGSSGTILGVISSASAARSTTRRRETLESNSLSSSGLVSPSVSSRFLRDETPPWFSRRTADFKDANVEERDGDSPTAVSNPLAGRPSTFGAVLRNSAIGATSTNNPMWGPSSPSISSIGSFGNFALPSAGMDKRMGSQRGESRLAHLLPKDPPDPSIGIRAGETLHASATSTVSVNPSGGDPRRSWAVRDADPPTSEFSKLWRTRPRTDTDPFGDNGLTASALLALSQDHSSSPQAKIASRASVSQGLSNRLSSGDLAMSSFINDGSHVNQDNGPSASPSATNPYRSPPTEIRDLEGDETTMDREMSTTTFNPLARAYPANAFDGSDRSQTSSAGPRTYPALSNMSGWPSTTGPASATPDHDHRSAFTGAFGSSLFSPMMNDMSNPGLASIGSGLYNSSAGTNNTGATGMPPRSGKLGGMYPMLMASQVPPPEPDSLADSMPDLRQTNPLGAIGRNLYVAPGRDADSPLRSARGMGSYEDFYQHSDALRIPLYPVGDGGGVNAGMTMQQQQSTYSSVTALGGMSPVCDSPPLGPQIRQMVMPDRMRWVYLDPQGQVRGPFTGLEMHDWYKGSFFTPDLRVKKVEDAEFEALGQLIRRIGNSREPFLVPQVGIPHGPAPSMGPFSPSSTGGVVPPLSGVFPSFGRTLTAEEQNNLERRKQEEQFMMAQQREYVMRHQAITKFHTQPTGPALQHHSSAHSLQSQPSYGSITSPIGMPSQTPIGTIGQTPTTPGIYDTPALPFGGGGPTSIAAVAAAAGSAVSYGANDTVMLEEDQGISGWPQVILGNHAQGSAALGGMAVPHLNARQSDTTGALSAQATLLTRVPAYAALRGKLPRTELLADDVEGFKERLQEFEDLRAEVEFQHEDTQRFQLPNPAASSQTLHSVAADYLAGNAAQQSHPLSKVHTKHERLSRDRKSTSESPELGQHASRFIHDDPEQFSPTSFAPMVMPAIQRKKSSVGDPYVRLHLETTDHAAAPLQVTAAQGSSLAPWARDLGSESQKGPSLKEIQEAEVLKLAKAEELVAAARKRQSLFEHETALKEQERTVFSGLPMTSTWASGLGATDAVISPWAKPSLASRTGPPAGPIAKGISGQGEKKKTLADIQLEEESRKQRAKDVAVHSGGPTAVAAKSYAIWASKTGASAALPHNGGHASSGSSVGPGLSSGGHAGWAVVGASGKAKVASGPTQVSQTRSGGPAVKLPAVGKTLLTQDIKAELISHGKNGTEAVEEFRKWVRSQLMRGITGENDIDSLAADLEILPLDNTIIADAVYLNSNIMNGRDFADEYIRRKKQADSGIVERQPATQATAIRGGGAAVGTDSKVGDDKSGSGWSEVVKRGGGAGSGGAAGSEVVLDAGFKVVPGRKKGKK